MRVLNQSERAATPDAQRRSALVADINELLDDDDYIDTGDAIDLLDRVREYLTS